jgi:hypothetical protein
LLQHDLDFHRFILASRPFYALNQAVSRGFCQPARRGSEFPAPLKTEDACQLADEGAVQQLSPRGSSLVINDIEIAGWAVKEIEPKIAAHIPCIAVVLDLHIKEMRRAQGIADADAKQVGREITARQVHIVMVPGQPGCEVISRPNVTAEQIDLTDHPSIPLQNKRPSFYPAPRDCPS